MILFLLHGTWQFALLLALTRASFWTILIGWDPSVNYQTMTFLLKLCSHLYRFIWTWSCAIYSRVLMRAMADSDHDGLSVKCLLSCATAPVELWSQITLQCNWPAQKVAKNYSNPWREKWSHHELNERGIIKSIIIFRGIQNHDVLVKVCLPLCTRIFIVDVRDRR